jgi:hypothetical protein
VVHLVIIFLLLVLIVGMFIILRHLVRIIGAKHNTLLLEGLGVILDILVGVGFLVDD